MMPEYSSVQIQEALDEIQDSSKNFKNLFLELSSDFSINTKISDIKKFISSENNSENSKYFSQISKISKAFTHSIQVYIHRLGIERELLIISQMNANMQINGIDGLNEGNISVIPFPTSEDMNLKEWFVIIDEQLKQTLELAYDYNNAHTVFLAKDLSLSLGILMIKICSLIYAVGIKLDFMKIN